VPHGVRMHATDQPIKFRAEPQSRRFRVRSVARDYQNEKTRDDAMLDALISMSARAHGGRRWANDC
jgi:hypothetical protein